MLKYSDLAPEVKKNVVVKRLKELRNQYIFQKDPVKKREIKSRINRGQQILKKLSEQISPKTFPDDATDCPVCGGRGEAPTQQFFTRSGQRTSGQLGYCTFCKGRGYLENKS